MIVPFENTLDSVTESRYKAVTDITVRMAPFNSKLFMQHIAQPPDKTLAHSHFCVFCVIMMITGYRRPPRPFPNRHLPAPIPRPSLPPPSLSPATIVLSELSKSLTALLHSAPASPELLFLFNARDTASLRAVVPTLLPFLQGRYAALNRYLKENEASEIRVSEKTRAFWVEKQRTTGEVLKVVEAAGKEEAELGEEEKKARQEYFENTKAAWEVGLALVLQKISKDLVGPYALGTS